MNSKNYLKHIISIQIESAFTNLPIRLFVSGSQVPLRVVISNVKE